MMMNRKQAAAVEIIIIAIIAFSRLIKPHYHSLLADYCTHRWFFGSLLKNILKHVDNEKLFHLLSLEALYCLFDFYLFVISYLFSSFEQNLITPKVVCLKRKFFERFNPKECK